MSFMRWQSGWNVLDIGCGGGANISRLLGLCPEGSVYGIDVSDESVAFARKKNSAMLGTRCFIEKGNVAALPYGSEQFDAVTAFETIYFWGNLNAAFAEVARVLRRGGVFMICCEASDPTVTTWTARIDGMRVYSADELKVQLCRAGFRDIEINKRKKEDLCVVARKG